MKYNLSSFLCGLLFGLGLLLSGMANPEKVLSFLDLAGLWDPSLALVMAGAIGVGLIAFTIAKRRQRSLLGFEMKLPDSQSVDRQLITGSLLFGAGWGLAGFCPGPGLVAMGAGEIKAFAFVGAMVVGMMIFEQIEQARKAHASTQA